MKVIYILSLGHSGSTILELTLSRFGDVIGLGELNRILKHSGSDSKRSRNIICACGQSVEKCSFWSIVPEIGSGLSLEEKYRRFFQFMKTEGRFEAAVDSSKNLPAFEVLCRLHVEKVIELYPVFLIRDVRGWICSGRQRDKRHHDRVRPLMYYLFQWNRQNRRIKRVLDQSGLEYTQVGYEQFCFKTEDVIAQIRRHAGLSSGREADKDLSNAHNLNGNRIRRQPRQEVVYDGQWFREIGPGLYPFLFPTIFMWNKRNVYKDVG